MNEDEKKDVGTSEDKVSEPEPSVPYFMRGSMPKVEVQTEDETEPESETQEDVSRETSPIQYMADGQQHDYVPPEPSEDEESVTLPKSEVIDLLAGRQATLNRKAVQPKKVDANLSREISAGITEGLKGLQTQQTAQKFDDDPMRLFDPDEQEVLKEMLAEGSANEKVQAKMIIKARRAELVNYLEKKKLEQKIDQFQEAVITKDEYDSIASINPDIPVHNIKAADEYLQEEGFYDWVQEKGMESVPRGTAYELFKLSTGKQEHGVKPKMTARKKDSEETYKVSQQAAKKVADQVGTPERGAVIGRESDVDKEIRKTTSEEGLAASVKKHGNEAFRVRGLPTADEMLGRKPRKS